MRVPLILAVLLSSSAFRAGAHVGPHPSVHDTVAGIIERLRATLSPSGLRTLDLRRAESFLTAAERQTLGSEHISFRVNVPVTVWIVRGPDPAETPFWLGDAGFAQAPVEWEHKTLKLTAWKKDFPAGWIGLGVNSLSGGGAHYLPVLVPRAPGLEISDLYPGQLRAVPLAVKTRLYSDREDEFESVPEPLRDGVLIQALHRRRDDARLLNLFRFTEHPASPAPDQVILTWGGDPKTTQSVQWRTAVSVPQGFIRFEKNPGSTRWQVCGASRRRRRPAPK